LLEVDSDLDPDFVSDTDADFFSVEVDVDSELDDELSELDSDFATVLPAPAPARLSVR
jgi:hypothetical protein